MKKWISVSEQVPDFNIKVGMKFEEDGVVRWESVGWVLENGIYSIKKTEGLTFNNSKPTHWGNIEK